MSAPRTPRLSLDVRALAPKLQVKRTVRLHPGLGREPGPGQSKLCGQQAFRSLDHARFHGALTDLETAKKSRELHLLLGGMHLFPVSDEVIEHARASFPIHVRAIDAVHVATAQVVREEIGELEFWTHDAQSASAAVIRGLDVHGLPS